MDYKTKGTEGTSAIGQRKESKLAKVNKKRANDGKRPGQGKKEKADDISNSFPNFSVLTEEEKLVFFEALSAARKNIEKKGLPTRERFGTVHDEYLNYFAENEKKEKAQKKPGSSSSVRPNWSPAQVRKNTEVRPFESPREKMKNPKPTSPLINKFPKSLHESIVRPESAPVDQCESVIKQETDKVIQMYLEKKKRTEEAQRKSLPANESFQPRTMIPKNILRSTKKETLQPKKNTVGKKSEFKAGTSPKTTDNPRFQSLNCTEREEFFRVLKEAHNNILKMNPQKEIFTLDEMLSPYKSNNRVTVGLAIKEPQTTKKKNLRVNITLTSGDNERISKSKSEIFSDQTKGEFSGRSKSLESLQSQDTSAGKQSKFQFLKNKMDESEECCADDSASCTEQLSEEESKEIQSKTEEKKKQTSIREKATAEEMKNVAKEKTRIITKSRKNEEDALKTGKKNVQETNKTRNVGLVKLKVVNLEKRKAECRKALKEKENRVTEAAKREKEFLKKKKVEERKKRLCKKEIFTDLVSPKKDWNKGSNKLTDHCSKIVRAKKKVTPEKVQNWKKVKAERKCLEKEKETPKKLQEEKAKKAAEECLEKEKVPVKEERAKEAENECIEENSQLSEKLLEGQESKEEENCCKEERDSMKVLLEQKVKQTEDECLEEKKQSAEELPETNKKHVEEKYWKEKKRSVKELPENTKKSEEFVMEFREHEKESSAWKKEEDKCEQKELRRKVRNKSSESDMCMKEEDECEQKELRRKVRNRSSESDMCMKEEDECEQKGVKRKIRNKSREPDMCLKEEDKCEQKGVKRKIRNKSSESDMCLKEEDKCEQKELRRKVRNRSSESDMCMKEEDECEQKELRRKVRNRSSESDMCMKEEDKCEQKGVKRKIRNKSRESDMCLKEEDKCEQKGVKRKIRNKSRESDLCLKEEDKCEQKGVKRKIRNKSREPDMCLKEEDKCEQKGVKRKIRNKSRESDMCMKEEDECEQKELRRKVRNRSSESDMCMKEEDECEQKELRRKVRNKSRESDMCLKEKDKYEQKELRRKVRNRSSESDMCMKEKDKYEQKELRRKVRNRSSESDMCMKEEDECQQKEFKKNFDYKCCNAVDEKSQIVEPIKQESFCFPEDSTKQNHLNRQESTETEEDSSEESFECYCKKTESQTCLNSSLMAPDIENFRKFLCENESEHIVRTATHSGKSFGGGSLVEQRPEEIKGKHEWLPPSKGRKILVDDGVINKIKSLICYLDNKVKAEENSENEFVRLVLNYKEYLTKVTESLTQRDPKLSQRVHSTYNAHELHLKFQDNEDEKPKEDAKKVSVPRSISDSEFHQSTAPKLSGIEKKPKEKIHRRQSSLDLLMLSDSESSSNSEGETQAFVPSSFKKAGIPTTKIRLLQDLLKGRAGYVPGSIDDFKIVRYPEPEFVPTDKPQTSKELTENDEEQNEKVIKLKFFKNLANLCRCGRKQLEEDAILENLKGEAVRVNTVEEKKDPASATINQSTMEVLKAAERKKIIDKYFKVDQS